VKLLGPATRLWVEDVTAGAAHPVPTPDPALFDLVTAAVADDVPEKLAGVRFVVGDGEVRRES